MAGLPEATMKPAGRGDDEAGGQNQSGVPVSGLSLFGHQRPLTSRGPVGFVSALKTAMGWGRGMATGAQP